MDSLEIQKYIETHQDEFLSGMGKVNSQMYKAIIGIILDNTHKGNFSIPDDQLATIEEQLYQAIKDSDYNKLTSQFLETMLIIESSIIKEQADINRLKAQSIKDLFNTSKASQIFQERVIANLGTEDIKNNLVKPMADLIRNESIFNKTSKDVVKLLSVKIEDGDPLKRYVTQVAGDTLNQYDGILNQEVKVAYGLDKLKYIGNLVLDSRPICTYIMNDFGGRLEESQLKIILNDYCPAGIPSDERITIKDFKGKEHNLKKGAGMIEGTVEKNFSEKRGGYQCRHRAIWVRKF